MLVPEDDEEPLEVELLVDFVEDVSDDDELEEDDDSAFAGTELLPVDRLSLR